MVQTIAEIRQQIAQLTTSAEEVVANAVQRTETSVDSIWIHRLKPIEIRAYTERFLSLDPDECPLYGVPFAIKDNIDLVGVPTTVGCPDFATTPNHSAHVVERLLAAGAIPVGKTNMDQFATGLTGTRSPYGIVANTMDARYTSGGSSSGSACAVAAGIVPFALGTDTAGSGRVPAAFHGLVGFKPTRGWWSTQGVFPACRSLDCVSVFTNTVSDARTVADALGGFDIYDPFSRHIEPKTFVSPGPRIGYFDPHQLPWKQNEIYPGLYQTFIDNLPMNSQSVDPELFIRTGNLLYQGPWIAERLVGIGEFLEARPESLHPITRSILEKGHSITATECFLAQHTLAELKREVEVVFDELDILVAPTCLRHFTIEEVESDPVGTNSQLGLLTNFVNLLDLCAIAIPAGISSYGLPFGVTLMAKAGYDHALMNAAATLLKEENELAGAIGAAKAFPSSCSDPTKRGERA